jgi:hypothetical protein
MLNNVCEPVKIKQRPETVTLGDESRQARLPDRKGPDHEQCHEPSDSQM